MTEATKATKKTAPKAKKASAKASDGFAVIATGGKQLKVSTGDTVKIEKLLGSFKEGDSVTFDSVLLSMSGSDVSLGAPFIKGASVTATITKIGRNKTIDVIKYKQKSRYFKKNGHRQPFFQVRIEEIK